MANKRDVLMATSFGKRVAEEEGEELSSYFVETDQWRRVFSGEVDIVYGPKGSGKSAIYSLILLRKNELEGRGITVMPAENPRGTAAFKDLVADPPSGENECRALWKIYFLSLIGEALRGFPHLNEPAQRVVSALEEAKLLPREATLSGRLKSVRDYVRRILKAEAFEGGIKINEMTGQPEGITGKIILREPDARELHAGIVSADELLKAAESAFVSYNHNLWLVLDRLDVTFADSAELESNALRGLFRVYLDLLPMSRVALKIFLRNDIWQRIMRQPFPEASHITRETTISWSKNSLLNLVIKRLLHNAAVLEMYGVKSEVVLAQLEEQLRLFYRVFPPQVDAGGNKPVTLDWMLSRTSDGSRQTAPRELIHLLSSAREVELKGLEIGAADPPGDALFDRNALKEALKFVSKARFEQTLCAEYPQYKAFLQKLEHGKTEQSLQTLGKIWGVTEAETLKLAGALTEVGFFEQHGTKEQPRFWVPFLYRGALSMVQGTAK